MNCHLLSTAIFGLIALVSAALPATAQVPKARPPLVIGIPEKSPEWLKGYRVRWPIHVVGDLSKQSAKSVIVGITTGGRLKADAADLAVQAATGELLPRTILSHDPLGETLIQFPRKGDEAWYWVYAGNDAPPPLAKIDPPIREGLSLELRDWVGENLNSWASVREGLKKSETVIGNAVVAEVNQNGNPARWDRPNRFAASYRGFLDIKKDGEYRFFINADDAAFLFIDGFKVFDRPGENFYNDRAKQKLLDEKSGKIELKAGVHPFEVHQAVGNNARSRGICALLWKPVDGKQYEFVPAEALVKPLFGRPAGLESTDGSAAIVHGIDDMLSSGVVKLYLVRFEAQGELREPEKLLWEFGDGTTATGRSVLHAYLRDGDHLVTLKTATGAIFRKRIDVWSAPVESSPFSLGKAVQALAASDWKRAGPDYAKQLLAFLQVSEQAERWPLLEAVTEFLLTQKDLELEEKVRLTVARIEALANLNKPREALRLAETLEKEVAKVPSLLLALRLSAAAVHQYQLKDAATASKMYKAMLDDYKRVEHPNLRMAAVRWGDLHAEAGDFAKAGEAYRLAATLGGEKFAKTAEVDAVTRGARLRIAEQKLKAGDVRQTRQLLEQIEIDFPEQKLQGLYRFLRAEADRYGGRYEDAIRNYEILVRLPQWAGYRDRALLGIADSRYRAGDLEKAVEWYAAIKQSSPDFYTKQKLDETAKLLAQRLARVQKTGLGAAFTEGFSHGFEPGEPGPIPDPHNFPLARGLAMQGTHLGLLDNTGKMLDSFDFGRALPNISPDGNYWIEFWYRETGGLCNYTNQQQAWAWIHGDGEPNPQNVRGKVNYIERSFGQWRKFGFRAKAPLFVDGKLLAAVKNFRGLMEIDALVIRPITDRQNDSLTGFLEGTEAPAP